MNGSHLIAYMLKLVGKCVLRLDRHRTAVHGNIEQSFSMHMALLIHVCWRKTSSFFILSRATTIYTTVARNVKDTCVFIPDLFSRPMLHCTCDVIFRDTVWKINVFAHLLLLRDLRHSFVKLAWKRKKEKRKHPTQTDWICSCYVHVGIFVSAVEQLTIALDCIIVQDWTATRCMYTRNRDVYTNFQANKSLGIYTEPVTSIVKSSTSLFDGEIVNGHHTTHTQV